MSDSKLPSDADKNPKPAESAEKKPAPEAVKPSLPPAKQGKGLISFVGRLRRSTRKSRAAAEATRQAAAAAAAELRREERAKAQAEAKAAQEKSADSSFSRSNADSVVKPISASDLDGSAKDDKKIGPDSPDKSGRLSIEKVERIGTRSQRRNPVAPGVVVDEKAEKRRRNVATGFKITLALIFFLVAGVIVFLSLRETRVKVSINTSPAFEIENEAWVVVDFQERIDLIKRDLEKREEPLRAAISAVDRDLSAAKADYAGRQQKRKLLADALDKDKAEIPVILATNQQSLEKLWREDADNLDAEYDHKKDAFNKEIAGRAKQLNLTQYAPSEDLDAPEIAVNAFRLALYSAPEGVDTAKERAWAEERLKGWRKFEDDWSDRQTKIKQEADALRQTVQPEIDDVKGRVTVRQEQINALDAEIDEFGQEVAHHEEKKKDNEDQLAAVVQPFYEDLLKAPNEYVTHRWQVEKLGLIDVRNMDHDLSFPPGDYQLLVKAKKKGVEYWALKIFTIKKYKTTQVIFEDSDFFMVKSRLENK